MKSAWASSKDISKYSLRKSSSLSLSLSLNRNKKQGFTLVELLIVIVVITILAAITIVAYGGVTSHAQAAAIQADLKQDAQALESYKVTSGAYPSSLVAAGIKAPTSGTPNYYPNSVGGYCLQVVNGSNGYAVTSDNQVPVGGDCTQAGLVGWWKFDGNTNDSSTTNVTVTPSGTLTSTTGADGRANGAYAFSASGLLTLNSALPTSPTALSVFAWTQLTTANSSVILGSGGGWGDSGYSLMWYSATDVRAELQNTSVPLKTTCDGTIASGDSTTWHLVGFSWSQVNGVLQIYVDGQPVRACSFTAPIGALINNLEIAGNASSSGRLNGSLDDVRIYNRALSANEIQNLYTAGAQ